MKIKNRKNLIKNLWLYRSFIFRFTKFESDSNDKDVKLIINGLNIKKKYNRIYYVIDKVCDEIDDYYKGKDICSFKNNKCICHRRTNKDYINGCCRKCKYQSTNGCTTKNYACKMFYCSYIKKKYKTITPDELPLLKLLGPIKRMNLKSNYFASIDEVAIEVYRGTVYANIKCVVRLKNIISRKYELPKK